MLTHFCHLAEEKFKVYGKKITKFSLVNVLWMLDVEENASADGFF